MKQTLCLLFLLPIIALSQSTTWRGANNSIWPSFAPSSFIIDKNGTNTITVNNINSLTNDDILMRLQQFGTNQMVIWPDGSVYHGYRTFATWVNPIPQFGYATPLGSYQDTTLGDVNGQQIYMYTTEGTFQNDFDVLVDSFSVFSKVHGTGVNGWSSEARLKVEQDYGATLFLQSEGDGGSARNATIQLLATEDDAMFTMTSSGVGGFQVKLEPSIAASGTPFIFGSDKTHTSGTLLTVANNTTNKFQVTFDGKIQTAAPVSTAGAWQLGTVITNSAVTLITDSYVEISIGGQVLKLAIVQ